MEGVAFAKNMGNLFTVTGKKAKYTVQTWVGRKEECSI